MITKIKYLKSIGKFYDSPARGSGLDWHNNTFLFAPNAYGKSTLVNVLKSLRDNNPRLLRARRTLGSTDGQKAVITIDGEDYVFDGTKWEKTCTTIQIFDAPFIHANILSHEIAHEHKKNIHRIIIGSHGVELAEQLAALKASERSKRQELVSLAVKFNAGRFTHHVLGTFLTIPADEEAAVLSRIEKLEQDIERKKSETTVRNLGLPRALSKLTFDLSGITALAGNKLAAVNEIAERRVLDHIERNIKDKGRAKEFIRQGLELVQADCPFCGLNLKKAAALMKAYREFFDDAFRAYQSDLTSKTEAFANWNLENALTQIVSSHNANAGTAKQWVPFIGELHLPDAAAFVDVARGKLTVLKKHILGELEKKLKDPNADVDIAAVHSMSAELDLLNTSIDAYNDVVSAISGKAQTYLHGLPKSDVDAIRRLLEKEHEIEKRFKPEWKEWATRYAQATKDANDLQTEKDAKQKALEEYTESIFDAHQMRINAILLTLGADFRISNLTSRTDDRANESYSDFGFSILEENVPLTTPREDSPCFKNTLSEGDKSTLAFAVFIAALEKLPDLDKQIVVLDDPLSSLDETRREATARVLSDLSPKVNQLCAFTHKTDFLWMLCDKMPSNNVLHVRSDRTQGSRLEAFDVEENRKGEYARMVDEMQRYIAEDFGPKPDTMQGNIRKVFEVVLKTKYYRALAVDIKAKKGLAKLLQTLFDAQLLDPDLKLRLFDLCNLTSGSHHGQIVDAPSKNLTRDELIPLITEAFELLKRV